MKDNVYRCFLCKKEHPKDIYHSITQEISSYRIFVPNFFGGTNHKVIKSIEVKICRSCFWKRAVTRMLLCCILVVLSVLFFQWYDLRFTSLVDVIRSTISYMHRLGTPLCIFIGITSILMANFIVVKPILSKLIPILKNTNIEEASTNNAIIK